MAVIGVTGATGFIGGRLVPYLATKGHTLKLIDNRSGPIRAEHPEWPAERLDLREDEAYRVLRGSEVVLHLAAASGVMKCAEDPLGTYEVNVRATRSLAHWCRSHGIPLAFASSFSVVGIPESLPITETTPARPTHEYARQKAEGENILRTVSGAGGVPTAILRMSNVYGRYHVANRTIAKGNVVNLFAEQALQGALKVNAPGTQRRDYIHLDDVVAHWETAARYLLAHRNPPETTMFDVASGESSTVLDLAQRVVTHAHKLHPDRPALRVEVVPNPRGEVELLQPEFQVSRRQTESVLGLPCAHTLDNSLDEILLDAERGNGH